MMPEGDEEHEVPRKIAGGQYHDMFVPNVAQRMRSYKAAESRRPENVRAAIRDQSS